MRKLQLEELGRPSLKDYRNAEKLPIVVVLDNIRSALNVGSIFRSSDAFRIEKILLCGITAAPPHKEILKTAIGATESVAWEYHENCFTSISVLKEEGYRLIGVEQTDKSEKLSSFKWPNEKTAVVFGNEVGGLSNEILPLLTHCIEISQYGTKHSLNVAVCAGIVLWQASQRKMLDAEY